MNELGGKEDGGERHLGSLVKYNCGQHQAERTGWVGGGKQVAAGGISLAGAVEAVAVLGGCTLRKGCAIDHGTKMRTQRYHSAHAPWNTAGPARTCRAVATSFTAARNSGWCGSRS